MLIKTLAMAIALAGMVPAYSHAASVGPSGYEIATEVGYKFSKERRSRGDVTRMYVVDEISESGTYALSDPIKLNKNASKNDIGLTVDASSASGSLLIPLQKNKNASVGGSFAINATGLSGGKAMDIYLDGVYKATLTALAAAYLEQFMLGEGKWHELGLQWEQSEGSDGAPTVDGPTEVPLPASAALLLAGLAGLGLSRRRVPAA